jgi:hypothetical protein
MDHPLPSEFVALVQAVVNEPAHAQEMLRYAIVLLPIDTEKARVLDTRADGEKLHLTIQTLDGQSFEIDRPIILEETEQSLLEKIREIVNADSASRAEPLDREDSPARNGKRMELKSRVSASTSQLMPLGRSILDASWTVCARCPGSSLMSPDSPCPADEFGPLFTAGHCSHSHAVPMFQPSQRL